MKKIVTLMLAVLMVLSIAACGQKKNNTTAGETTLPVETTEELTSQSEQIQAVLANTQGFRVGYARVNITPEVPVPLAGFGNTSRRMSTKILRPIYASCLAIVDEQGTGTLLFAIDLINTQQMLGARELLEEVTGIPVNQIMLNASHTHAGPDCENSAEPSIQEYIPYAQAKILEAGVEAMLDLKPAAMYTGSIETENMNFIKHYQYVDDNGQTQYFGDNFGTQVLNETTEHTTQIDETMYLIQFKREGEKDILAVNWRAHPLIESASTSTNLSADFIGAFREAAELTMDCEFMYFQGAAGNNNSSSRIVSEVRTTEAAEYGAILADYAKEGLKTVQQVEPGLIQSRQTLFVGECMHETDYLYTQALSVASVWNSLNDKAAALAMDTTGKIRSVYVATSIVRRYGLPETMEIELDAVSIGDHLAFVTAPLEMYDSLGELVEKDSPYDTTIMLAFTNGYMGYMPSAYGWVYTSYETDVTWFVPGTGELIVEQHLKMLEDMAK